MSDGKKIPSRISICCRLLLLSVWLAGSSAVDAETQELLTLLSPPQVAEISRAQGEWVERIKKKPTAVAVHLVRLNLGALSGGSTRISIPNAKSLIFDSAASAARSATDFTWSGTLGGDLGRATLIVRDGNVTGTIGHGGDHYRIEPVGDGVHALVQMDESRYPPDHPPGFEKNMTYGQRPAGAPDLDRSGGPVDIDVLVAYTSAARSRVYDITALVRLAVEETNQSYRNSKIDIRMNLVDSFEATYSENGKEAETILDEFAALPEVQRRRDASGADMAVMIIDNAKYCGLATAVMARASNAFAIVYWDCATGYYSFAHELGHLQGATHDPANDRTVTPFAYGHGHQHLGSSSWRTIMAYASGCGSCPRIQYWSSPNLQRDGAPMGTWDVSDNARVLNETATTVAGFRPRAGIFEFLPQQNRPEAVGRSAIALMGDVNKDGRADLIWNEVDGSNSVNVGLGQTDGTFKYLATQKNSTDSWPRAYETLTGDVDGDGRTDLIWKAKMGRSASYSTFSFYVGLARGGGTFEFRQGQNHPSGGGTSQDDKALVGDFNGDGRSDLLWLPAQSVQPGGSDTRVTTVYLGHGLPSGAFEFRTEQTLTEKVLDSGMLIDALAGDINKDGRSDLILIQTLDNAKGPFRVVVGLGTPSGIQFLPNGQPLNFARRFGTSKVLVRDVNKDGRADLIWNQVANKDEDNLVFVGLSKGDGTFGFQDGQKLPEAGWSNFNILMGDVDGDGRPDLIWNQITDANRVYVGLTQANGAFEFRLGQKHPETAWQNFETLTGDVNGDGRVDLVWNRTASPVYVGIAKYR